MYFNQIDPSVMGAIGLSVRIQPVLNLASSYRCVDKREASTVHVSLWLVASLELATRFHELPRSFE